MEIESFTSRLTPETKFGVIQQINKFTSIKCDLVPYYLNRSNKFYVDLKNSGIVIAELEFSDDGVSIVDKHSQGLQIDLTAIDNCWKQELFDAFGSKYGRYLDTLTKPHFGAGV